ncbi:hypothetical protein NGA_2004000, partial [Nannochloropsis gaditana CCMP526]|uniref:uncharacterized protein n=1 Tax=Nannochloropsis gaditana (strain CCMP526) TaxID=1093141 RepID=UPI00029F5D3E
MASGAGLGTPSSVPPRLHANPPPARCLPPSLHKLLPPHHPSFSRFSLASQPPVPSVQAALKKGHRILLRFHQRDGDVQILRLLAKAPDPHLGQGPPRQSQHFRVLLLLFPPARLVKHAGNGRKGVLQLFRSHQVEERQAPQFRLGVSCGHLKAHIRVDESPLHRRHGQGGAYLLEKGVVAHAPRHLPVLPHRGRRRHGQIALAPAVPLARGLHACAHAHVHPFLHSLP